MTKLLVLFFVFISFEAFSKDLSQKEVKITKIFEEEDSVIWGFSFLDKNNLLLSFREGRLVHLNFKSKKKENIGIPTVHAYGQGGLLDVQKFEINGLDYIYITYSQRVDGIKTTSLARAPFKKGKVGKFINIFNAKVKSDTNRHYGSRLAYDGKYIFMTVGDRGKREFAQDLNLHNGKILRLTPEGKAAPGNPFEKNGLPEIWTYGHRNPQGIYYDSSKGGLYSCEFGPRGGDELNVIVKGKNYGWPVITYGSEYYGPKIGTTKKEGMEQPLVYWVPSISPSGMTIYKGDKYVKWKGDFFLANLSSHHIRRVKIKEGKVIEQQKILEDLDERIRAISTGPEGYLYFSTDSGLLYKIIEVKD